MVNIRALFNFTESLTESYKNYRTCTIWLYKQKGIKILRIEGNNYCGVTVSNKIYKVNIQYNVQRVFERAIKASFEIFELYCVTKKWPFWSHHLIGHLKT